MELVGLAKDIRFPIRERREELGLTQEELASRAMVSRQTIVRLENGRGKGVAFDKLLCVLQCMGMTFAVGTYHDLNEAMDAFDERQEALEEELRELEAERKRAERDAQGAQDEPTESEAGNKHYWEDEELLSEYDKRFGKPVVVDPNLDYKAVALSWAVDDE